MIKGKESAYKKLYQLYYNELCAYVSTLTNDRDLSEDIVQNVIFTIWKNKERLNINSSLKSYLYKSCYNEFVDAYKQQQKKIDYITSVKVSALDSYIDNDYDVDVPQKKILLIRNAMENLPTKCKKVFTLVKIDGLKYKEVAEEMKISIKTVEAHMGVALKKIKEQI